MNGWSNTRSHYNLPRDLLNPMFPILPDLFRSEDTLYHYTKMNTAIEHILWDGQLRLSPRKDSIDPMESSDKRLKLPREHPFIDFQHADKDQLARLEKMALEDQQKINQQRQLCFCSNPPELSEEQKFYHIGGSEDYGCFKPRMWDQYGEQYRGVCLAFSKEVLQKDERLEHDHLTYASSIILAGNQLILIPGLENSSEAARNYRNGIFSKHSDYRDESEYRFCLHSDEPFEYTPIKAAIRGIFVAKNFLTDFNRHMLKQYAKRYQIPYIEIIWNYDGPVIEYHDDWL